MDSALEALLKRAKSPILDYGMVMDALSAYKAPRKKIHDLIKKGTLIMLKRGLYLLQVPGVSKPYSVETIANLLYGPSHISLEWACQYYGLIPERVTVVTSVCQKRSKEFKTPIGLFTFKHQKALIFSEGVEYVEFAPGQKALIASKEKALADLLTLRRGQCSSLKQMQEILFEDLRIDSDALCDFDLDSLNRIQNKNPHSAVTYLIKAVEKELS